MAESPRIEHITDVKRSGAEASTNELSRRQAGWVCAVAAGATEVSPPCCGCLLPGAEGVGETPWLLSLPSPSPSCCYIGQAYLKAQRSRHLGSVPCEWEGRPGKGENSRETPPWEHQRFSSSITPSRNPPLTSHPCSSWWQMECSRDGHSHALIAPSRSPGSVTHIPATQRCTAGAQGPLTSVHPVKPRKREKDEEVDQNWTPRPDSPELSHHPEGVHLKSQSPHMLSFWPSEFLLSSLD
nr:uncharacterized protein LOC123479347 [Desmodus rotundus]